jgi:segregation and condensation protein B
MDYFGINSAEELPKISEVLAETMVEPTLVNADHFDMEGGIGQSEGITGMGQEISKEGQGSGSEEHVVE